MSLPSDWALPIQIRERFGLRSSGRQRAMTSDGHLLLVLHKVPGREASQREGLFFWRKPTGEWTSRSGGDGLKALQRHVQSFAQAEEQYSKLYDQATKAEDYFHILETIPALCHSAKNLLATLQSAREAIPEDRDLIDLRDWAYDISRSWDLLYEDTRNALDFNIARKTEEQARLSQQELQSSHRLNVLAAIFFPITAIAGIFGMNLPSGLENASTMTFWVVLIAGIFLGFAIYRWVVTGSVVSSTASRKAPSTPKRW
ncbi:MAG: hypothetical protein JXA21_09755 [Anaerolineae bacterium]|nr:hypothetical protein [Anaerolineae bacterium]